MINALDAMIHGLRKALPETQQWHDENHETKLINHARLRGKWYGAQYIIHRPFLHYALELDENGTLDWYLYRRGLLAEEPRVPKPAENKNDDELIELALRSAEICIGAARRSTTAFDEILDHRRLCVTNIFGTIHA